LRSKAATPVVAAIVVAAGSSQRMGGVDKLWLDVEGRPLLSYTLDALTRIEAISQVVVVLSAYGLERSAALRDSAPWNRVAAYVPGGAARSDSVYAGLRALGACDVVLVHDGARPLVTPTLVRDGVAAALVHGAAIPAIPLTDTVKQVDAAGLVVATPDRAALRTVQTPQVFRLDVLRRAHEEAGPERSLCTDDAMLLERLGVPVATFRGDPLNVKISTPDDLPLLWYLMAARRPHSGSSGA